MKKFLIFMMGVAFVFGVVGSAAAADQSVTLTVAAIDALAANTPITLTVDTATAGSAPDDATGSTSYNITTNASNRKITGVLDSAVPAGTTLTVNMAAPAGGTSAGDVVLSTSAQDLVTGITKAMGSGLAVNWTFSADATADPGSVVKTVTFTLTNM